MLRRQRPGGGRHPPPLAPTVSNFKPRAQWNNSGSSIILYVNLPGFYRDQLEIKKDEKTRAIYIQGQRPLSTHTKARFNEIYRVPESFDMTKLNISFSHGLLTMEFLAVVEGEKTEKAGNDQEKTVQRTDNEENRGTGLSGSSLGQKKPLDKEKQVGSQEKAVTTANKEEPKTYKSVVEGKRAVPAADRVKTEENLREGEASSSSGPKDYTKQEKVVEKKEAAKIGQHKTVQKIKEEEARNSLTVGGSLKPKVLAIERKKDGNIGQRGKDEGSTRTPTIGGSLEPKVHFKEEKVAGKGAGEIGKKLKEEGLGDNKEKMVERITQNVNGNVISKHDKKEEKMVGYRVSEGEIQERVEENKAEEAGLVKETRYPKGEPEVMEPRRVDSDVKEDLTKGGEDREKMDTLATTEGRGKEEERIHI